MCNCQDPSPICPIFRDGNGRHNHQRHDHVSGSFALTEQTEWPSMSVIPKALYLIKRRYTGDDQHSVTMAAQNLLQHASAAIWAIE